MSDPNIENIISIQNLRKCVGITNEDFDQDLKDLCNAAIKKLKLSGIVSSKIIGTDSLIVSTIKAYIRGNYRYTKPELAQNFLNVFEENKNFMSCTQEYTTEKEVESNE